MEALATNPANAVASLELVNIYLLELDNPMAASRFTRFIADEKAKKLVPLAARPAEDLTSEQCMELGEWYEKLAGEPAASKPAMLKRARLYYEQFLLLPGTDGIQQLRAAVGKDADAFATQTWQATQLLDSLGLHTVKTFQKAREDVINRQQREMLELSTPVVKLWEGILALPMIGTLDSARTQVVMESLLQKVVETGAQIAILDITGVPTVDTLVAQHLLKTVVAARLMGAECTISGIRPQIAQTIVALGIEFGDIRTRATLADALVDALRANGRKASAGVPA